MRRIRGWLWRLRCVLRRERAEREMEEELRLHLEYETEKYIRQGMEAGEARRRAVLAFGGMETTREELRASRGLPWAEAALQDVRFALRGFRRSPGFTAAVVLTLALGIGANTAIFSVVHGVLLRSFPYPEAGRVVTLWQHDRAGGVVEDEVSAANLLDWRERSQSFSGMAALEPYGLDYQGPDGPVSLDTWLVTEDFFSVMGVPALLGRTLTPADYRGTSAGRVDGGGVPSLVLSHAVWREQFGGDPAVVGRSVTVDGAAATVVGVMPPDFQYPTRATVWAPVAYGGDGAPHRGANYLQAVGRLREGVGLERARAELALVGEQLAREHPQTNREVGITAVPLPEHVLGGVRPALLVLLGAVGFVLLIACVNVAGLLLARGAHRQRELAVRSAIGAGRGRLLRQLTTESLLLALLGGTLGALLALASVGTIVRLAPAGLPRLDQVGVHPPVLGFAAGLSLLTVLLFGLGPALRLARPELARLLAGGARVVTRGRRQRRVREGLVVFEIALALILLVGAGLVVRSFVSLLRVDPGYRADGVMTVTVQAWSYFPDAAQRAQFVREAQERMAALPGVAAVGMTSSLPLAEAIGAAEAEFQLPGTAAAAAGEMHSAHAALITDGYLQALRIPLLQGRRFTERDDAGAPYVVLVNESLARRHWPGRDPVGESLVVDFAGPPVTAEVVGVVGDVRHAGPDREAEPSLYFHYPQAGTGAIAFTLRTTGNPYGVLRPAQEVIWDLSAAMPISHAASLEGLLRESLRERRFSLLLLAAFSLLALVLAAVGVYGLLSFTARQRTVEIGVRLALGARAGDILRWTLGDGVRLAALGLLLGGMGGVLVTRLLRSLLYGVQPTDPLSFAGAAALLAAATLCASYLPARRAARVDPVVALRAE